MNERVRRPAIGLDHRPRQRGAALIIGAMLLLIVTLLGVTGLVAAALELQMAGNLQFQERAFQAAEFAIEQAISSAGLSTAYTFSNPKLVPAPTGELVVAGSAPDAYNYRLYFDSSAGSTPIPGGSDTGSTLVAYHFVISGSGHSMRGAQDTHVQGFYVLGPAGCDLNPAGCNFDGIVRHRTYWAQQGAE